MTFDQTKEMWRVHVLNKIPKVHHSESVTLVLVEEISESNETR